MLFNNRSLFASCFAKCSCHRSSWHDIDAQCVSAIARVEGPILNNQITSIEAAFSHVENFLNYVNDGDYINNFFHRSAAFIRVGGFAYFNQRVSLPADPPVTNEYNLSNLRGDAMAKLAALIAPNQWFINLADNAANLDNQNGGFTVFGTVTRGMAVADTIADLDIINANGVFNNLPIRNISSLSNPVVWDDHLVLITQTTELVNVPTLPRLFSAFLATLVTLVATQKSLPLTKAKHR